MYNKCCFFYSFSHIYLIMNGFITLNSHPPNKQRQLHGLLLCIWCPSNALSDLGLPVATFTDPFDHRE